MSDIAQPGIKSPPSGFTIVEMVIILVLVGIVSAVAVARFLGANTFNAIILRDQIIGMLRVGQQSALGRPGVTVTIQPVGNEVTLTVAEAGGTIQSLSGSLDEVTLSGDINITDSCGTSNGSNAISNATPMTITFDELADLGVSGVTGNTGVVTSALRICINNDPAMSVCVAPSGFAYAGDCDA